MVLAVPDELAELAKSVVELRQSSNRARPLMHSADRRYREYDFTNVGRQDRHTEFAALSLLRKSVLLAEREMRQSIRDRETVAKELEDKLQLTKAALYDDRATCEDLGQRLDRLHRKIEATAVDAQTCNAARRFHATAADQAKADIMRSSKRVKFTSIHSSGLSRE